jgi:CDP-6-deoxy-D-xylo-4-hexulose-3-dehydrase
MFAHTLGNPADMDAIMPIVREHDLIMIEDVCDALGSTFGGQVLGTFGEVATLSFYPAHHITLGEGGAVFTRDPRLARIARSVRDWGRDCWCGYENPPDGKCGRRFEREVPGVSGHYDHRYFFTEIGYNLKLTDPQAALGLAQLEKLPDFAAARRRNFQRLYSGLQEWEQHLLLPRRHAKADPSWFAFPISVRASAPFNRQQLMRHLDGARVETRVLFAGNVLRHPGFSGIDCRAVGELSVSDRVLRSTFFVGVYPGLDEARIDYMLEVFADFMRAELH